MLSTSMDEISSPVVAVSWLELKTLSQDTPSQESIGKMLGEGIRNKMNDLMSEQPHTNSRLDSIGAYAT
ncbi:hypothetical protein MLD38_014755 [Melastoma candidum]|uniref:Uncharacterized protein n=1 Tax=Melastoma candidum TaxID=119954 RepID=A0ACB9RDE6_9MYRT|nr:hypothetical protein MLD38_014755 [Melastoma candidum]